MTPMDQALETLRQDMRDPKNQSQFYDLFLNSTFYVPTAGEEVPPGENGAEEQEGAMPLIIDLEGTDYLMIFDTEERLRDWTGGKGEFVPVPGYVLAATSLPPLHWALNAGTDFSKQFHPEEIAWLRDVVERCRAAAGEEGEEGEER